MEPAYETHPYRGLPTDQLGPYGEVVDSRILYLKLAVASLAVAIIAGLIIYFVKPNAFLKVKGDRKSGIDVGIVLLTTLGVFVVTFAICFLLHRSVWPQPPVPVTVPVRISPAMG